MAKYNKIEFCSTDYENEEKRWADITALLRILIKTKNAIKVWDDGLTTTVEYNFADPAMNGVSLDWVSNED